MKNITPNLWFDTQAEEAANRYVSLFGNAKIGSVARYGEAGAKVSGKPRGSVLTVEFELEGQEFVALNGGPEFAFSPAVSFTVNCRTPEEFDRLWETLSSGGTILIERNAYPFSKQYGWLQDAFGVSWQLNRAERAQKIAPSLLFVGEQHGKAEEAMRFYTSVFRNSAILGIDRYGVGEEGTEGTVKHAAFTLGGQEFMAMDGGRDHRFTFTPAISFIVNCETQEEVDTFWRDLSDGGRTEPCGWLADRYGVSWQVVPAILGEMLSDTDSERTERVMEALLKMTKIDIRALNRAYERQFAKEGDYR